MKVSTGWKIIGNEVIEYFYDFAKKVYHKQLEKKNAVEFLFRDANMNETSAKDYIYVFNQMKQGLEYKRTIDQIPV